LVLTGLAPADPRASLSRWLGHVGGGITLTLFSAVPKGSGLGTSSILGAAVIRALDRVVGRERTPSDLVAATSALEQMLSTRGGWQDQVGGALGGFKFASTAPGAVQHPQVQPIAVPAAALRELRSRSVLCFTGQRRMAKGILENVVWNWLSLRADARSAVAALHANAERMRGALTSGDVDAAVQELGTYRELKRRMDPGSCSPLLESLADRWRRHVADWCFAGAGGGGFVLLVAHDARHAASIRAGIEHHRPHPRARAFDLEVEETGLRCAVL
jgi:galactokinase/mevalonate kinase-like predicted kinase